MASEWAAVSGVTAWISASSARSALAIGLQPLGWAMWMRVGSVSARPRSCSSPRPLCSREGSVARGAPEGLSRRGALGRAGGEGAAGGGRDYVLGRLPLELADDLKGGRLRAL